MTKCKIPAPIRPKVATEDELKEIQEAVCRAYGTTPKRLHSSRRNLAVCEPRQVVMFFGKKMKNLSLKSLGKFYGLTHGTVWHARNKVGYLYNYNRPFRERVNQIMEELQFVPNSKVFKPYEGHGKPKS